MKNLYHTITEWLAQYPLIYDNLKYLGVILLAYISYLITKKIFFRIIRNLTRKTKTEFDDVVFNVKIIRYISIIVPLIVIQKFAYIEEGAKSFIELAANALIIIFTLLALGNLITSVTEHFSKKEKFARQPIKGYAQVAKIFLYVFGSLFVAGIFTGEKPWVILTGLGALSAIILLIFKDTILSFVASIQISSNELLKIGDWIEIPSFGADGEVADIALHTVKIQNWDKTFTLIPTYKLVENSFKNWRGMEQSGCRRIKRHISIDINSIRFIKEETVKTIAGSPFILPALKKGLLVPGNNQDTLTNLGLFIKYSTLYLKGHPQIRKDLTSLVRTLQSTSEGLPVEIYSFCSKTDLVEFEEVQKEIFEYLLALLPVFELEVFQKAGGNDIKHGFEKFKK